MRTVNTSQRLHGTKDRDVGKMNQVKVVVPRDMTFRNSSNINIPSSEATLKLGSWVYSAVRR